MWAQNMKINQAHAYIRHRHYEIAATLKYQRGISGEAAAAPIFEVENIKTCRSDIM